MTLKLRVLIELNEVQAGILTILFEDAFEHDTEYFTLIDIEEIFALLLGEDVNQDIYELLERTYKVDEHNEVMIVFLSCFIEDIISAVKLAYDEEGLEYWELANNCNILKNKLDEILNKTSVH